jgi:hypothetical protein
VRRLARRPHLWCPACERRAVEPTPLGFLDNDGRLGTIAGFACARCLYIWAAPDAAPVVTAHVDLGGRSARDVFLEKLAQHGCDPRPVPDP